MPPSTSTGIDAAAQAPPRAARAHRPGKPPRPVVADAFAALVGTGLGVALALVFEGITRGSLAARGGWLTAAGELCGFVGAYLFLVMVLLVGRVPSLERAVGQHRLLRWHRRIAPLAVALICAHVVTITLGYAEAARVGAFRELWTFVTSYSGMLMAVVGFALLLMAAVTSVRIARRRMKYETWWAVHLYTYLGLGLAFLHQITNGAAFVGHPLARTYWIVVWIGTAGVVLAFRVFLPLARSWRYQLRVVTVREEAPDVYSVVCSGRGVERLAVSGGQYFQWRFLTKGLWWHAHPYSLSALPHPPFLRLTVKVVGDQSEAIASLRPGTRVMVEGPYGAFTTHARSSAGVALIGAGVGVTPLRALLEELPPDVDVTMVVRSSSAEDFVHRKELETMIAERGGRLRHVAGPRQRARFDRTSLHALVPDIVTRDVYVCGPEAFSRDVVLAASALGVGSERIHREDFSL